MVAKDCPYRPNTRVRLLCLALFLVMCGGVVQAQGDSTRFIHRNPTLAMPLTDNQAPRIHSPRKALILSAVLPGAGQVYNHQAWKIPIIYAALGGVGYYSYSNYIQMKSLKEEYLFRVQHDNATGNAAWANYPTSNIYNMYDSYNKTFQLSIIIGVAVYGLNLLDAYVFGHLFDFQIDDDLSFQFSPGMLPLVSSSSPMPVPSACFSFRF